MSHDASQLPRIVAQDRHSPVVDAIEAGDVRAALEVVHEHMAGAAELYAAG